MSRWAAAPIWPTSRAAPDSTPSFCRRKLTFIGPAGEVCCFAASRWLPAPLHLAPGLQKLAYLTREDRRAISRAMWRLMRTPLDDLAQGPTARLWLEHQGQSERAIELFWSVVLVSALGESLEHASMAAARKVFVDGFLAAAEAYVVQTPQAPLGELIGKRLPAWLERQGAMLQGGAAIERINADADGRFHIDVSGTTRGPFDRVVIATTWRRVAELLPSAWRERLPWLAGLESWPAAPITGAHLWFDRPLTELPHAVLVGRLGQWLFNRSSCPRGAVGEHYYQVVISASRDLAGRDREAVARELCDELRAIWPAAREAKLLRYRIVTEPMAVFSVRPGSTALRPAQHTAIEGLFVAGDWTATGWPATMEGAVRGGYLAAEGVAASLGEPRRFLQPDLRRSWLARLLIRE